jgi:hypothetical protein
MKMNGRPVWGPLEFGAGLPVALASSHIIARHPYALA